MLPDCIVKEIMEPQDNCELMNRLVIGRTIAAAASNKNVKDWSPPPPEESCKFGSMKYFFLCGLGGVLSCGTTHTLITPLDLVKCRMQVDPERYKSIAGGFQRIYNKFGYAGLVKGWSPTLFGYSIQGMFKFGLYEVFKVFYSNALGEENAYLYRTGIYLAASASAEFFADIGLSPFEAAKVKMQTNEKYTSKLRETMPNILREEGIYGFYKSLVPLWLRQIPYTMMKFTCFERTVEALYKYVVPKKRSDCTKAEQLIVTFAAGYIAGVFCALVSHPADTLVSKLNQKKDAGIAGIYKEIGMMGLWKGLVPRIIMIGTLTGLQWFIYDAFKVATRMPRPPPPEMPASLKAKLEGTGKKK